MQSELAGVRFEGVALGAIAGEYELRVWERALHQREGVECAPNIVQRLEVSVAEKHRLQNIALTIG